MTDFDPLRYAGAELVPLLRALRELAHDAGETRQEEFFAAILRGVEVANEPADLMDPFLRLSTSAFQGFAFGIEVQCRLDQLLERAQLLAESLSRQGLSLQ